jgi:hypothetical protein
MKLYRIDTQVKLRYPLALLLLSLIACVSNNDFEDELQQERIYLDGVCTGIHGDYLNLQPTCPRA